MAEPTLELAPYEISPWRQSDSAKRDGAPFFFEANCLGRKRTFVGLSTNEDGIYGNALFFGLPDKPQLGHFVCAEALTDRAQHICSIESPEHPSTHATLIDCIEKQSWGRYFVLNSAFELANGNDGKYTLFLASNGHGKLVSPTSNFARFKWSQPCALQIWETPYLELLEQILEAKENIDEVNFAFRWANMSKVEQFDLVYPLKRGSYSEWKKVCEWCILSLDLWREEWASHKLEFSISRKQASANWYPGVMGNYKIADDTPFHKFARWSHHYFFPVHNEEPCNRYSHIDQWAKWYHDSSPISGSLSRPTLHERIEARIRLWEWLADKATPEEIEELLRED